MTNKMLKKNYNFITLDENLLLFLGRGRVDELLFLDYSCAFCFLLIEFHLTFSMSDKILTNYVYYYYI